MRSLFIAVLGALAYTVTADKTFTVDGQDLSIHYTTVASDATNSNQTSWTVVARNPASCDTPQMLTSKLGDYMTFTFTGTGVSVIGTIGKKRGFVNFTLDDSPPVAFDRSNPVLVCDSPLFVMKGLPYQQHTVVATLIGEAPDFSNGSLDAVLSVQRIQYFIPGSNGPPIGAIAGGAVGGVVVIAAIIGIWLYRRRRAQRHTPTQRTTKGPIDFDDSHEPKITSPGIIATPFEWHANGPQTPRSPPSELGSQTLSYGGYASPTTSMPPTANSQAALMHPTNNPYFPPASSSGSDSKKRESSPLMMTQANPDRQSMMSAGSGQAPEDEHLVDRIANRLADIMTTRTGAVGMDGLVPPPVYVEGAAGPSSGAPGYTGDAYGPGEYPREKAGGLATSAMARSPTPPSVMSSTSRPLPRSPSPPGTRPGSELTETGLAYAQGGSGYSGQVHPYAQPAVQPQYQGGQYGAQGSGQGQYGQGHSYGRPRPPPPV